jgi:hypothetical protein
MNAIAAAVNRAEPATFNASAAPPDRSRGTVRKIAAANTTATGT